MSDAHRDEIAKLEALYAENPEGRIFTHLAEAYRKAGELERAHEVLEEGIGRHPDYSSAHVVLGRVLVDRDRAEEAEAEFRRVLELDPHNMIAIRSLADLARVRGDDAEALEYYNRLLEVEPSDEEARAIVEEMTTGVPASEDPEPETAVEPGEPWAAAPGWGEPSDPQDATGALEPGDFEPDDFAGDLAATPTDDAPADADADTDEPEPSPWADEAGPEPQELEDEFDAAPWATTAPEPGSDLEWIGGAELPDRDDGIESDLPRPDGEEPAEPFAEPDEAWGDEDTEVRTETIAQVYARQGLYDRAAEVYRELVRMRPDDERLRERLAEMEQLAARTGQEETAAVEGFAGPDGETFDGYDPDAEPGEIEPEEEVSEPEPYAVEGLQTADFDSADVEAASLDGLEVNETDPVTGLRSESADEGYGGPDDVDDHAPAEVEAYEAEPDEAEPESAASPWTDGDWGGDEAEVTPHAWTDEEPEADRSSPIRSYFSGLLDWSDVPGAEPTEQPAGEPSAPPEAPAVEDGSSGGAGPDSPGGPAAGGSEDDDDLDMFRSWLESLKQ